MYEKISRISFPKYQGNISVNMMPIVFGDKDSVPEYLSGYLPILDECKFRQGSIAYLTVNENIVKQGKTQRRPGLHTEGTRSADFGRFGGSSIGSSGVYMASTDGACRIWNTIVEASKVDEYGGLSLEPKCFSERMAPETLYWLTDRTPHEALPVAEDTHRQFFRLVSEEVSVWWAQHSTPNPLGIKPNCKILTHSKF